MRTLFALIWREANKTFDSDGEETDIGVNGSRKALKLLVGSILIETMFGKQKN